ncbi:MAG: DUF885 family protein [Alphaproteobacteria bacterium]|nr:DUF885 family protein [Alphaproteobacteria bacterium]
MSRRAVVAALGSTMLIPIVAGQALGATQSGADKLFAALAKKWLDGAMKLSPVSATQIGDHRFDAELDDMSAAGRNAGLAFAKETLASLDAIDKTKLSRANQVDAALLSNALHAGIWQTESVQDWAWNPLNYQQVAGGAVYGVMAREFAPLNKRLESATRRMELMPTLLKQARSELVPSRVPAPHADTYSKQNKGLKSIVGEMIDPHKDKLSPEPRKRLDAAVAAYNAAVDEHQEWIDKTLVPAAKADFRAGAERFDKQLQFTLVSNLDRAEIRRRAEKAVVDCRKEMYDVARKALTGKAGAPPTPDAPTPDQEQAAIKAALDLAAADRPARDKLVQVATDAVESARQFVIKHDLITLPAGPVRVILMPEFQRGFAVAYCDSPGPLDKNLATFYAVSPIPDDWTDEQTTSFLREYNTRGITDIGVHEAMPGHYVQLFHSNSYPSVLRAILGSGSFIEGWAVYAEQFMVDQGFKGDDPLYKLTQLKIQLRAICNAIIDQAIHVDGMTQEQMMKLLTETAFQEEREAAGKWRRAQLSVTQLSTYFVGYSEHMETREAAMQRDGAKFNLKKYHDGILAFGSPPMRYARALYLNEPIQ